MGTSAGERAAETTPNSPTRAPHGCLFPTTPGFALARPRMESASGGIALHPNVGSRPRSGHQPQHVSGLVLGTEPYKFPWPNQPTVAESTTQHRKLAGRFAGVGG